MLIRATIGLICLTTAATAGVCVSNGTGSPAFFTVDPDGSDQSSATLQPLATLCSGPGTKAGGVVRVFEDETAIEGCSRRVPEGRTETLIEYVAFDRCHWSSHDE